MNKHKNPLQILVEDLHNDMISPIYQGGFFGEKYLNGKVCIGDTSLRNYTPKYTEQTININNITCGCKKIISDMLLQLDLNEWRLSLLGINLFYAT